MSGIKRSIYDVLKGNFLTDESAFKNWRMIIFIVVLLLIMISNAHSVDKKMRIIDELSIRNRKLRGEYISVKKTVTRIKMESNIRERAKQMGLQPSETPPERIKVISKDQ